MSAQRLYMYQENLHSEIYMAMYFIDELTRNKINGLKESTLLDAV